MSDKKEPSVPAAGKQQPSDSPGAQSSDTSKAQPNRGSKSVAAPSSDRRQTADAQVTKPATAGTTVVKLSVTVSEAKTEDSTHPNISRKSSIKSLERGSIGSRVSQVRFGEIPIERKDSRAMSLELHPKKLAEEGLSPRPSRVALQEVLSRHSKTKMERLSRASTTPNQSSASPKSSEPKVSPQSQTDGGQKKEPGASQRNSVGFIKTNQSLSESDTAGGKVQNTGVAQKGATGGVLPAADHSQGRQKSKAPSTSEQGRYSAGADLPYFDTPVPFAKGSLIGRTSHLWDGNPSFEDASKGLVVDPSPGRATQPSTDLSTLTKHEACPAVMEESARGYQGYRTNETVMPPNDSLPMNYILQSTENRSFSQEISVKPPSLLTIGGSSDLMPSNVPNDTSIQRPSFFAHSYSFDSASDPDEVSFAYDKPSLRPYLQNDREPSAISSQRPPYFPSIENYSPCPGVLEEQTLECQEKKTSRPNFSVTSSLLQSTYGTSFPNTETSLRPSLERLREFPSDRKTSFNLHSKEKYAPHFSEKTLSDVGHNQFLTLQKRREYPYASEQSPDLLTNKGPTLSLPNETLYDGPNQSPTFQKRWELPVYPRRTLEVISSSSTKEILSHEKSLQKTNAERDRESLSDSRLYSVSAKDKFPSVFEKQTYDGPMQRPSAESHQKSSSDSRRPPDNPSKENLPPVVEKLSNDETSQWQSPQKHRKVSSSSTQISPQDGRKSSTALQSHVLPANDSSPAVFQSSLYESNNKGGVPIHEESSAFTLPTITITDTEEPLSENTKISRDHEMSAQDRHRDDKKSEKEITPITDKKEIPEKQLSPEVNPGNAPSDELCYCATSQNEISIIRNENGASSNPSEKNKNGVGGDKQSVTPITDAVITSITDAKVTPTTEEKETPVNQFAQKEISEKPQTDERATSQNDTSNTRHENGAPSDSNEKKNNFMQEGIKEGNGALNEERDIEEKGKEETDVVLCTDGRSFCHKMSIKPPSIFTPHGSLESITSEVPRDNSSQRSNLLSYLNSLEAASSSVPQTSREGPLVNDRQNMRNDLQSYRGPSASPPQRPRHFPSVDNYSQCPAVLEDQAMECQEKKTSRPNLNMSSSLLQPTNGTSSPRTDTSLRPSAVSPREDGTSMDVPHAYGKPSLRSGLQGHRVLSTTTEQPSLVPSINNNNSQCPAILEEQSLEYLETKRLLLDPSMISTLVQPTNGTSFSSRETSLRPNPEMHREFKEDFSSVVDKPSDEHRASSDIPQEFPSDLPRSSDDPGKEDVSSVVEKPSDENEIGGVEEKLETAVKQVADRKERPLVKLSREANSEKAETGGSNEYNASSGHYNKTVNRIQGGMDVLEPEEQDFKVNIEEGTVDVFLSDIDVSDLALKETQSSESSPEQPQIDQHSTRISSFEPVVNSSGNGSKHDIDADESVRDNSKQTLIQESVDSQYDSPLPTDKGMTSKKPLAGLSIVEEPVSGSKGNLEIFEDKKSTASVGMSQASSGENDEIVQQTILMDSQSQSVNLEDQENEEGKDEKKESLHSQRDSEKEKGQYSSEEIKHSEDMQSDKEHIQVDFTHKDYSTRNPPPPRSEASHGNATNQLAPQPQIAHIDEVEVVIDMSKLREEYTESSERGSVSIGNVDNLHGATDKRLNSTHVALQTDPCSTGVSVCTQMSDHWSSRRSFVPPSLSADASLGKCTSVACGPSTPLRRRTRSGADKSTRMSSAERTLHCVDVGCGSSAPHCPMNPINPPSASFIGNPQSVSCLCEDDPIKKTPRPLPLKCFLPSPSLRLNPSVVWKDQVCASCSKGTSLPLNPFGQNQGTCPPVPRSAQCSPTCDPLSTSFRRRSSGSKRRPRKKSASPSGKRSPCGSKLPIPLPPIQYPSTALQCTTASCHRGVVATSTTTACSANPSNLLLRSSVSRAQGRSVEPSCSRDTCTFYVDSSNRRPRSTSRSRSRTRKNRRRSST